MGLGEEDGMVLLAVGNSGGVGVDIGEMRNRRRRKLETASTGGIFLPSREDLVLGRYFPESTTGPPPPCLPNPPQPKKGQARPLIVNAVAPLSLTADRVSSLPIFLFSPSSCFAGISPNSFIQEVFSSRPRPLSLAPTPSGHPRLASRASHAQDHVFQKRHPHVHWQQWRRGSQTRRRRIYC